MNKIIEINSDEKWVITEPGITIDNLNESVKKHNLHFTPDPSTKSRANVGGAMGNNGHGGKHDASGNWSNQGGSTGKSHCAWLGQGYA